MKFSATLGRKNAQLSMRLLASAACLMFSLTGPAVSQEANHCGFDGAVPLLIAKIALAHDGKEKILQVQKLQENFDGLSEAQVANLSEDVIDLLVSLLDDESDVVQVAVAEALGRLGYRAERALPSLDRISKLEEKPIAGPLFAPVPLSFYMNEAIDKIKLDMARKSQAEKRK